MKPPYTKTQRFLLILGITICVALMILTVTPNYLTTPPRSSSRALSDLRTMATALETYYIDWESYPPGSSAVSLTTPVQHLCYLMPDRYSPSEAAPEPYLYYASPAAYLVYSRGPDKDVDLYPNGDFLQPNDDSSLMPFTFDVTNGTNSSGDLWRKGSFKDYGNH